MLHFFGPNSLIVKRSLVTAGITDIEVVPPVGPSCRLRIVDCYKHVGTRLSVYGDANSEAKDRGTGDAEDGDKKGVGNADEINVKIARLANFIVKQPRAESGADLKAGIFSQKAKTNGFAAIGQIGDSVVNQPPQTKGETAKDESLIKITPQAGVVDNGFQRKLLHVVVKPNQQKPDPSRGGIRSGFRI